MKSFNPEECTDETPKTLSPDFSTGCGDGYR